MYFDCNCVIPLLNDDTVLTSANRFVQVNFDQYKSKKVGHRSI